MNKSDLISKLKELNLKPNRLEGQNFLIDTHYLEDIVRAAAIKKGETVVEIGPGLGVLTKALLDAEARVVAIEKERVLGEYLRRRFAASPLSLLIGNAVLKIPALELPDHYKVVANLPYSITSPVLRLFLARPLMPAIMVLMVQKEVAERLTALPGSRDRGWLTVLLESLGTVEIIKKVPPSAFYPTPKVDSAIIKVVTKDHRSLDRKKVGVVATLAKAGFGKKRAQLKNALKMSLEIPGDQVTAALESLGVDPRVRAEDLSIQQWYRLARKLGKI